MINRFNVITAGPSAGKSSTIRELSARGWRTLPEAARILFDQRISQGIDPEEVRAQDDFQDQVEQIDRRIETNIYDEQTFLDRSLADNIAYRRHNGEVVPDNLYTECEDRYERVFLLERIDFKDDEVRTEDEEEAAVIQERLRNTYEELGYDVIDIPVMPVNERADEIEQHVPLDTPGWNAP